MSANDKVAATFHPYLEPGFGDVDVHAAERFCNCGHRPEYHEPHCILCRCAFYIAWGTE